MKIKTIPDKCPCCGRPTHQYVDGFQKHCLSLARYEVWQKAISGLKKTPHFNYFMRNIVTDLLKIFSLIGFTFAIYFSGYIIGSIHDKNSCPIVEPVIKYLPSTERAMDCNKLGGDYLFYLHQDMNLAPRESCRIDKIIDSF